MNRRPIYQLALTAKADGDILDIIAWSVATFGDAAADRYEALIGQALIDLSDDPFRPGAKRHDELQEGVHAYHLTTSRDHVAGDRVKAPRHLVIYRVTPARIDVLRILHDSRDLVRHIPEV